MPVALSNSIIGFGSDVYLSKLQPKTKLIPIIGVAVIKEKKSNGNISVNANVVNNTYSVHYVVSNSKRHYFYPGIGFGWTMYKLNFLNHENAPASYPDALQNFNSERNIQSADLTYLNFAANYDFAIFNAGNLFLGLRAAYHLGLNNKNLRLGDDMELTQSPKLNANALSIGVALTIE